MVFLKSTSPVGLARGKWMVLLTPMQDAVDDSDLNKHPEVGHKKPTQDDSCGGSPRKQRVIHEEAPSRMQRLSQDPY